MKEHETLRAVRSKLPGERVILGDREVDVVTPNPAELWILRRSLEEEIECASVSNITGDEKVGLRGRFASVPVMLLKIGILKLHPKPGSEVLVTHSHWMGSEDIRPSPADYEHAIALQGMFRELDLKFRVISGDINHPAAYQYLPLLAK